MEIRNRLRIHKRVEISALRIILLFIERNQQSLEKWMILNLGQEIDTVSYESLPQEATKAN